MSALDPAGPALSRRGLLVTSGLTVSLATFVAACGGAESGAPGRVGNAPVPTDLPTAAVTDAVLLRTATSLEYTALDVYRRITELGPLDERGQALVARFIEDHTRHAAGMADLTTQAGGEAYECANPWFASRVVDPLIQRLTGDEAVEIEPSDDIRRDALSITYGLESTLGAMYQQLVELLADRALRGEAIAVGAEEHRHAAAVAIARDGAPAAYISPVVFGDEIDPAQGDGVMPLFAVNGAFGSLAPVEFTLGPLNEAGSRFVASMQTPADNSFVYEGQSCDA